MKNLNQINFIYDSNGCGKTTISNFVYDNSDPKFNSCSLTSEPAVAKYVFKADALRYGIVDHRHAAVDFGAEVLFDSRMNRGFPVSFFSETSFRFFPAEFVRFLLVLSFFAVE